MRSVLSLCSVLSVHCMRSVRCVRSVTASYEMSILRNETKYVVSQSADNFGYAINNRIMIVFYLIIN